jgi:hypothetical protein
MPSHTFGTYHVRKWFTHVEEVLANESGQLPDGEPLRKFVVSAAIHNPYAHRFSADLSDIIDGSDELGREFGRRAQQLAGDTPVQSYGKAAVVGVGGEYEHGNAFLTQTFADPVRAAIGGGKSWVPSTGKIAGPGATIDIPLAHKDALYVRSHYDTVSVSYGDAPRADEVVIAFAFASRGRLHARLGGLDAADVRGEDGLH